jgi:hypothetical protein
MGSLLALIHPFGEACQKELKIAIKYVSVIIKNYTKQGDCYERNGFRRDYQSI